mgnify:CR=1 FL=1
MNKTTSVLKGIKVIENMMPNVLEDMTVWFREQARIQIAAAVEGEGRGGSLRDEGSIKRALMAEDSPFRNYVIDQRARRFGDIIVKDYNHVDSYVVNIKTSIGGNDNCFSKCGIVYAFTDLSHDDRRLGPMNFMKMNKLINDHKADIPNKDYWFLCVNKKNPSEVMIRGAKQINNWVVNKNPSNILQVNWRKEKNCAPVERTWDEAYNVIIGGAKKSLNDFWNNIPEDWKFGGETKSNDPPTTVPPDSSIPPIGRVSDLEEAQTMVLIAATRPINSDDDAVGGETKSNTE